MKRIVICIIITLLSNLVLIGCASQKPSQEPPEIAITIGDKKYPTPVINIPFELKDSKYTFEIKKNIEVELDSFYEKGMTYFRGFRIIASWGRNECEYGFVIKTDR